MWKSVLIFVTYPTTNTYNHKPNSFNLITWIHPLFSKSLLLLQFRNLLSSLPFIWIPLTIPYYPLQLHLAFLWHKPFTAVRVILIKHNSSKNSVGNVFTIRIISKNVIYKPFITWFLPVVLAPSLVSFLIDYTPIIFSVP